MIQVNVTALDEYFQAVQPVFEGGGGVNTYGVIFKKPSKIGFYIPTSVASQNENCSHYSSLKVLTYITSAPIFSDPSELGHLIFLAYLIIGLYLSIKPGFHKIGLT